MMTFMVESEPEIDFKRIEFPSDKLTVKMIRDAWPAAFDVETSSGYAPRRPYVRHSLDYVLEPLDVERMVAERAFKAALGKSFQHNDPLYDRDELVGFVTGHYVKFKLARGKHEATEMIRGIEGQAEAQAREHGTRTP